MQVSEVDEPKIGVNIKLTRQMDRELEKEAFRRDVPKSLVVQEAIASYLPVSRKLEKAV
jgi:predicted transcriptional regulator